MFCPLCGSAWLKRSHTRGFEEKLLKSLGFKAFRCGEELCNWRGLLKIGSEKEIAFLKVCKGLLIFMVVLLLTFLAFVFAISADYLV
jgi:hypothetical protein